MVPFQLPTGKTVFLTFQEWENMTDLDLQDLMARDEGYDIENPFDKVLDRASSYKDNLDSFPVDSKEIPEELPEEIVKKIEKKD